MNCSVQINLDAPKLYDIRTITIELDSNILRLHLNNAAQDYIEQELDTTGFPGSSIQITVTQDAAT